jgi:DNA-3-methyladenine glycosylase
MRRLPQSFYRQTDVQQVAQALIGKYLFHRLEDTVCAGRIVETEAYIGITDRASHSYKGRRTARNEHMYASPGTSYVYICYGMHALFNVVTNAINIPDAVLIRALEPIIGIEYMMQRTGKRADDPTITRGPGNLCRAMGIDKSYSGISLLGSTIFICEDPSMETAPIQLGMSKRIGVEGAGPEAAAKPYRYYVKGNRYVSGSPRT